MKRIPALVMLAVAGSALLISANAQQYDIDGNLIGSKTTVTAPAPSKIVQKRPAGATKTTTTTTTPTTTIKSCKAVCDPQCNGTTCSYGDLTCDGGCKAGYGLDPTNHTCIACTSANCSGSCNINGPATCDGPCIAGYGLQASTHLCKPCAPHCNTTGLNSGCNVRGAALCDGSCQFGYGLTPNYICSPCDSHCTNGCQIQGTGKCDGACQTGWALNASTHLCRACDSNCISGCSVPGMCDSQCKIGYGLYNNNSMCYACAPNCVQQLGSCDGLGPGTCKQSPGCIAGYALTPFHACAACGRDCNLNVTGCSIEGANHCDPCSPTPCSSCLPGYGIMTVLGDSTKHACYPCAMYCKGVCDIEGAGCCDPTSDPTTACTVGYTYTATNGANGVTCHKCI